MVQVSLWTRRPSLAFPRMMQEGTPSSAQGGQEDDQLDGSTLCAVTTSWAFLFSTRW